MFRERGQRGAPEVPRWAQRLARAPNTLTHGATGQLIFGRRAPSRCPESKDPGPGPFRLGPGR